MIHSIFNVLWSNYKQSPMDMDILYFANYRLFSHGGYYESTEAHLSFAEI